MIGAGASEDQDKGDEDQEIYAEIQKTTNELNVILERYKVATCLLPQMLNFTTGHASNLQHMLSGNASTTSL